MTSNNAHRRGSFANNQHLYWAVIGQNICKSVYCLAVHYDCGLELHNWPPRNMSRRNYPLELSPFNFAYSSSTCQSSSDNPAAAFIAERCQANPNALRRRHRRGRPLCLPWPLCPPGPCARALAAEWQRLGFERHRIQGSSYWFGVTLLPALPLGQAPVPALPVPDLPAQP